MRAITAPVLMVAAVVQAPAQSAGPRRIDLPAPNAVLPAELTLVTSVRELVDGRLLIVDRAERKLLVADWGRGSIAQIGRHGSGPGEYLQPSALLALAGDSTLLPDPRNGRWLLLAGTAIAETIGPSAPAIASGARLPRGADTLGHVIATASIRVGPTSGSMPRRDSVLLVRITRRTGSIDTVAVLEARPASISIEGSANRPTSVDVRVNPLAAGDLAALFPDGWIAVARVDPYRIDWIAPDGERVRGAPLPFDRVRLDEGERRAFLDREAVRTGRPRRDPASLPEWPEIMPPFLSESLLPAPDGRLWIRRPPTAAHPTPPYDVVDRRGALVARVAAGKDVHVVGFGRTALYTVVTDADGIQRLQRRPVPDF